MKNYIEVKISELKQITNKSMFIGSVYAKDIMKIIKYTNRTSLPADPFNINKNEANMENINYYQRIKKSDRAYDIKLYLLKNIYHKYNFVEKRVSPIGVFPSAVIISLKSFPEEENFQQYEKYLHNEYDNKLKDLSYLNLNAEKLYIPNTEHALIVDGQHRIAGFEALFEEISNDKLEFKKKHEKESYIINRPPKDYILNELNNYKFIISFLLDYDLYEQGEIFAMVNFNQKPVNKSFYYDIFGSISSGRTIEKLLHDIVAHLNYNINSPFKGYIKMLGTGPGYISQAFLVEALHRHFYSGVFYDVFSDFLNNGDKFKEMPKFLRAYYRAFTLTFNDYIPKPDSSYKDILIKTTGLGAISLLMPYLINRLKDVVGSEYLYLSEDKLQSEFMKTIGPLSEKGSKYFGENGDFSKSAGLGLQSKLYEIILDDLKKIEKKRD